jgi:hypothetical protein
MADLGMVGNYFGGLFSALSFDFPSHVRSPMGGWRSLLDTKTYSAITGRRFPPPWTVEELDQRSKSASEASAKQVGSQLFFAPTACHEKIARNPFARPVLNSHILMSCPNKIEGVGQCVIKALYLIKGLGA